MKKLVNLECHQICVHPNQIVKNMEAPPLRNVDRRFTHFKNLVKSIRNPLIDEFGQQIADHGLINPIDICPHPKYPGKYCIIDGFHRFSAWRKVFGDFKPIPACLIIKKRKKS